MKSVVAIIVMLICCIVVSTGQGSVVHAQIAVPAPGYVAAANNGNPGEVSIARDAVSEAAFQHVFGKDRRDGDPLGSPMTEREILTTLREQPTCPMPGRTVASRPTTTVAGDYDADDDGLIEVSNLAQLDAMRYDRSGSGKGSPPSGEDSDSYHAAFPDALEGMGCPEAGCIGYELVMDLDFDTNENGEPDEGDAYWNDGGGWLPIGYTGEFDGGGHTIANLYIRDIYGGRGPELYATGLFASAGYADIRNVVLTSVNVVGHSAVGSLVGSVSDDRPVTIADSCASGTVSGNGSGVGGLVGSISGSDFSISGSYFAGTVSGEGSDVGGLVGKISRTTLNPSVHSSISGSHFVGAASGSWHCVGGLVGSIEGSNSEIIDSHATVAVSSQYKVGGLVGRISSSNFRISKSYVRGTVSGSSGQVGGLVGESLGDMSIEESYVAGAVSGSGDGVGGLVGLGSGDVTISKSHAEGGVSGTSSVGGLVGTLFGSVSGSGVNISDSRFTGAVIGSSGNVGGLAGFVLGYFNISESLATSNVAGATSVGGLAGALWGDRDSSIIGSYATGAVIGSGNDVGGLVGSLSNYHADHGDGYNSEPGIAGSYATGRVASGGDNVGGLVGAIYGGSSGTAIRGSYATGMVSGAFAVGGLVGSTSRGISYSYAVGRVSGSGAVGGLIGDNTGAVTDSYWDTVTSRQSQSDGGQGKTTVELQSPTGYTGIYVNWNIDLDGDGVEDDPWDFDTPFQYPALQYGSLMPLQQPRSAAVDEKGVLSPVG